MDESFDHITSDIFGFCGAHICCEASAIDARWRIFENLVGDDWAYLLSDDPRNNLEVLKMAADSNAEIADWWDDNTWWMDGDDADDAWDSYRPSGIVYPLEIPEDYWFEVGPDFF